MKYTRVIPRDFFNEAKLLKCMGLLTLKILDCQVPDNISICIEECGEAFEIVLSETGYLSVANYSATINGKPAYFYTPYNSKANYPFYCEVEEVEYEVFNEAGDFAPEFIQAFKANPIDTNFISEWSDEQFTSVKRAIAAHFKHHTYELVTQHGTVGTKATYNTFKQLDNVLGLAYTSSSSFALLSVCNAAYLMIDPTHHLSYFAVNTDGTPILVAQDENEHEIFIKL